MKQQLFASAPVDQRLEMIKERASSSETRTYVKPASQEEIDNHRRKLANEVIKKKKEEAEKKEVMAEYKGRIKEHQSLIDSHADVIEKQGYELTDDVFLVPDFKENKMGYYDKEGQLISERELMPHEKQMNLYHSKEGTNG